MRGDFRERMSKGVWLERRNRLKFHRELRGRSRDRVYPQHHTLILGVEDDCHAVGLREGFLQKLQRLLIRLGRQERQPRGTAARTAQTANQSGPDRISGDCNDNGNRAGRPLSGLRGRRVYGDDHVDIEIDELASTSIETVNPTFRVPVLDGKASPFDPAEVAQALPKSSY